MFDPSDVEEVIDEWVRNSIGTSILRTRVRMVVYRGNRLLVEREEERVDGEWQIPSHKDGNGWEIAPVDFVEDAEVSAETVEWSEVPE